MADYNSNYTGQQIDNAVAKATKLPTTSSGDSGKTLQVDSSGNIVANSVSSGTQLYKHVIDIEVSNEALYIGGGATYEITAFSLHNTPLTLNNLNDEASFCIDFKLTNSIDPTLMIIFGIMTYGNRFIVGGAEADSNLDLNTVLYVGPLSSVTTFTDIVTAI